MLVLDETRRFSSDREGLSQWNRMIRRDRNHPCVVFWSTGNEEALQGSETGARICSSMKRLERRLDPTRLITQAMNDDWGRGISAVLDVQGFNYKHAREIEDFRSKFPSQPCVGTEVGSTVSTRGIYANDKVKGYVSAYDVNFPEWASTAEEWWQTYDQRAFLAGGFVWTGFDYRGEPTPYSWPCISSHFGIMDTCGFPKDNYYYYQAWWSGKPVLHLFPHWNWAGKEGQEIEVWCHTNLERVELFLNGQSLGSQTVKRASHLAWKVKYAPGALLARGYRGGQEVLTDSRETTGAAAKIELRPDRRTVAADGEDVSVVEVRVVDQQGRTVPAADNEITFLVSGAGKVIGVGNGDPSSHEPDKAHQRRAFNGLCVAIIQSSKTAGEIKVEATSPGLASVNTVIQCEQATPRPAVA
jgi:beta-galactosidase